MAVPLKLVLLGPSVTEVKVLVGYLANQSGGQLTEGEVGGCPIQRFTGALGKGASAVAFTLFAASQQSDFRGVYDLLFQDAVGFLALVPADLTRVEESRRTLGLLHRGLAARRTQDMEVTYLLQYHWPAQAVSPTVQELDRVLGVNSEVVQCAYSQEGRENQSDGLSALLKAVEQFKA